ncbi:hypothetical protein [Campylobacter troglodytis]|uniref:hypothetical protein n=1 Tax=Campylobacter troglodytis TaxID=654363 RepID=UPI001159D987|nr:hypothetical protein [Campylobacter troglodytis]
MRGKSGCGAENVCVFTSCYSSCNSARRYAKTQSHEFIRSNTCSAKELLPIRDFDYASNTTILGKLQSLLWLG